MLGNLPLLCAFVLGEVQPWCKSSNADKSDGIDYANSRSVSR